MVSSGANAVKWPIVLQIGLSLITVIAAGTVAFYEQRLQALEKGEATATADRITKAEVMQETRILQLQIDSQRQALEQKRIPPIWFEQMVRDDIDDLKEHEKDQRRHQ